MEGVAGVQEVRVRVDADYVDALFDSCKVLTHRRDEALGQLASVQWLQRHPDAGSSSPSWPKA